MSSEHNIIDHRNGRRFDFGNCKSPKTRDAGSEVLDALYYTPVETRSRGKDALAKRVIARAGATAGEEFCRELARRVWRFCELAEWDVEVWADLYLDLPIADALDPGDRHHGGIDDDPRRIQHTRK